MNGGTGTGMGTARGRERRQRLLDATAELVAVRGFHSVGIAEIGAAAGVTGSAIYRHFENKHELLVALFDQVLDELIDRARTAVGDADNVDDALADLVRAQVAFALRNRAVIVVYGQEEINLPVEDRRRLRRKQRAYVQVWADTVSKLRPELTGAEVVAAVSGAIGLLNSVSTFDVPMSDADLGAFVTDMALGALRAGAARVTA